MSTIQNEEGFVIVDNQTAQLAAAKSYGRFQNISGLTAEEILERHSEYFIGAISHIVIHNNFIIVAQVSECDLTTIRTIDKSEVVHESKFAHLIESTITFTRSFFSALGQDDNATWLHTLDFRGNNAPSSVQIDINYFGETKKGDLILHTYEDHFIIGDRNTGAFNMHLRSNPGTLDPNATLKPDKEFSHFQGHTVHFKDGSIIPLGGVVKKR